MIRVGLEPKKSAASISYLFGLGIFCSLFCAAELLAQVTVNTAIVHFKFGQRPVMNVEVGNSSDHEAYVVVEVKAVPEPGVDSGKTVDTEDLLVSPRNFSIEPNGERTVRLLLRKAPTDTEQVYRVSFVPQDRGFGEEYERQIGKASAIIRVLSGMGILVFADPVDPTSEFTWERSDSSLSFTNSGNVHIYFGGGQSCAGDQESDSCDQLPSKRLYPGHSFEVNLPKNQTAFYTIRRGASGEFERIKIPPEL